MVRKENPEVQGGKGRRARTKSEKPIFRRKE